MSSVPPVLQCMSKWHKFQLCIHFTQDELIRGEFGVLYLVLIDVRVGVDALMKEPSFEVLRLMYLAGPGQAD